MEEAMFTWLPGLSRVGILSSAILSFTVFYWCITYFLQFWAPAYNASTTKMSFCSPRLWFLIQVFHMWLQAHWLAGVFSLSVTSIPFRRKDLGSIYMFFFLFGTCCSRKSGRGATLVGSFHLDLLWHHFYSLSVGHFGNGSSHEDWHPSIQRLKRRS